MANVHIEPRPKGHAAGARIDDYVVEDHADHVLATCKTQREAIDWAKKKAMRRTLPALDISMRASDKIEVDAANPASENSRTLDQFNARQYSALLPQLSLSRRL